MCIYIVLILPDDRSIEVYRHAAVQHRLPFRSFENEDLQRHLHAGERMVRANRGHCDCDTDVGRDWVESNSVDGPPPQVRSERHAEWQRQRLQRRGWSAARVAKWEAQRTSVEARDARVRAQIKDDSLSLEEWRTLLGAMLTDASVNYVGLLIHMFSGLLESESFRLVGRGIVRIADVSDVTLRNLKWDYIYEFRR
jgi:hypothetical protein